MQIVLEGITKSFGEEEVLRGVDFTFDEGKIYGLLGRNGAGKTTLFKTFYGDLPVDSGTAYIIEDGVQKPLEPKDVGMLFSEPILPEYLTGEEFVRFFMDVHELDGNRAKEELAKMEFSEADMRKFIKDYSSGMRSRLSLLTLMMASPKILLLDEPLTSLDVIMAAKIKSILKQYKSGHILIFSTHIMEVARDLCEEIVLLRSGKTSSFRAVEDFEEELIEHLLEGEDEDKTLS